MATSRITYNGNLRTECLHIRSGSVLSTDAPVDNEGLGESFSPTDLTATSLGACMITIMGIKARKNEWELGEIECEVTKIMASDPRRIAEIHVMIHMSSSLDEKQRSILERVARTCPVALSLAGELIQKVEFNYR